MPEPPRNNRRGQIGLGDLLTALDKLADKEGRYASLIGRCLGFAGVDPNPKERRSGAWDQTQQPDSARAQRRRQPAMGTRIPAPQPGPPAPPAQPRATDWRALEPVSLEPDPPDWLQQVPRLSASEHPLPFQPLLAQQTARPIIGAAVATLAPGREPDMPALIGLITRLRLPREIPMLPFASLERGVDLLLDQSEGMEPFFDDLRELAGQVRRVVGRARHNGYSFRGDPFAASRRRPGQRTPLTWRPTRGRPVLLATDFGLNAPPEARDTISTSTWRAFGEHCRQAQSPAVALVPRRPSLWPPLLFELFFPIHWDPRTRSGSVRHLTRGGHRIQP